MVHKDIVVADYKLHNSLEQVYSCIVCGPAVCIVLFIININIICCVWVVKYCTRHLGYVVVRTTHLINHLATQE